MPSTLTTCRDFSSSAVFFPRSKAEIKVKLQPLKSASSVCVYPSSLRRFLIACPSSCVDVIFIVCPLASLEFGERGLCVRISFCEYYHNLCVHINVDKCSEDSFVRTNLVTDIWLQGSRCRLGVRCQVFLPFLQSAPDR